MIHLQMIYFNEVDEHDKVVKRWHQQMDEKLKTKKELEALRYKLDNAFVADGKNVDVRFQYLTVEE